MKLLIVRQGNRIRRVNEFAQAEAISMSGNDRSTVTLTNGGKTISVMPDQATVRLEGVTHKFTDVPDTGLDRVVGRSSQNSDQPRC